MRYVSYEHEGRDRFGCVVGQDVVDLSADGRYADLASFIAAAGTARLTEPMLTDRPRVALDAVALQPVIPRPTKILCIGVNYELHRQETGRDPSAYPTVFTRFADTLVGHDEPIQRPRASEHLDFEGELAIVIGQPGRAISRDTALDHVAGYTCFNDATVRDWQRHTSQFTPGKNFPRTAGLGPWLVTPDQVGDASALTLTTRVNGAVMQDASTSQLIFDIPELIAYCSGFTPLAPGDVIATGTPGGVGAKRTPPVFLQAGDLVEVEISAVGVLRNTVEAEPAA